MVGLLLFWLELNPRFSEASPFFTLLHPRAVALGQEGLRPTSRNEPFCLHSNIVRSLSGGVNECVLYLPSPFLQPDGCPDLCNGNGRCTLGQNSWQCVCQTGWRGPGCNVAMETACADNKDNEGGEQKSFNSQSLQNRGLHTLSVSHFPSERLRLSLMSSGGVTFLLKQMRLGELWPCGETW